MAQRVQVHLVDDLTGEEAEATVRFGLDGTDYEIDLTTNNAEQLRSVLSGYVDKGRKVAGGRRNQGGQKPASASPAPREDIQQIRQWARDQGHNPSSKGRIAQSIIDAYNKSH